MLKDREDPEFDGDREAFKDLNMTKEEVGQAFYVLTNHVLSEQYDKHNIFYTQEDFVEKKKKSITTVEKYILSLRSVLALSPYLLIMNFALGDYSITGRKMATIGLLLASYICFMLKLPSSKDSPNWVLDLAMQQRSRKIVVDIFGEEATSRFTIHQLVNFI
mmetsp:Transcript_4654/g.7899  ORF Transcript_4654/g.7899 Transcript_4654/m.7899 type:complete len:162 (+) Transcript_4654:320-805(+)